MVIYTLLGLVFRCRIQSLNTIVFKVNYLHFRTKTMTWILTLLLFDLPDLDFDLVHAGAEGHWAHPDGLLDSSDKLVCCATSERVSIHHDQKDGSEFSDVTLASEDDNDNSDVIVLKKLEKFSKGEDLQDALQCNMYRRIAASSPMLLLLTMMIMITRI